MDLPSPKRQRLIKITPSTEVGTRRWSDLPPELLSPIADRLGLIELLSFRGVCKDWHSASSTASARIESKPWFLLHTENSQCIIQLDKKKKYTITIPELEGSTCLASYQGWLLLFREGSIFFLCPFSGAKIDLPQFPHSQLSDHVAAISSPPTSQGCIVSVINRCNPSKLELNVLCRGATKWTKHQYYRPQQLLGKITCATYHSASATFYYMDDQNGILTFSDRDRKWVPYRIAEDKNSNADYLPFLYRTSYFRNSELKKWLELEEDVSVSTCGTLVPGTELDMFIHNESVEATEESERSCHLKGIWIHPRFHQIPLNQSWSL